MPQIQLTAPAGRTTDEGRATIQQDLARLLKWEGAPDNEFFKALGWVYLHELPAGAQVTAADTEPRFRVDVTVPQFALNDDRKAGLAKDVESRPHYAAGLGPKHALRVWVLINEQTDGTWAVGGRIFRHADLVALAKG